MVDEMIRLGEKQNRKQSVPARGVPEVIEMTVHGTGFEAYIVRFIPESKYKELERKFAEVVKQRNTLVRHPDIVEGLKPREIIKELDAELEIKSE